MGGFGVAQRGEQVFRLPVGMGADFLQDLLGATADKCPVAVELFGSNLLNYQIPDDRWLGLLDGRVFQVIEIYEFLRIRSRKRWA